MGQSVVILMKNDALGISDICSSTLGCGWSCDPVKKWNLIGGMEHPIETRYSSHESAEYDSSEFENS